LRKAVHIQTAAVNTTADSMEQIMTGLNNLNSHIAVQVGSVTQSSSAIEQMLANISSVTETLQKNTENISNLAESSETGRLDIQKIAHDIQSIAKDSEGLLEINSVMENISSQTNLLSMNAAIEAAHAGEAGKGFAVVAGEIRKLAENSGKQSQTISLVLKKITSSIHTITNSTNLILEHFGDIENEVKGVAMQENHIRTAMEEQSMGSRDILQAISKLNEVTNEVSADSEEMIKTARSVLSQTNNLKEINADVAEKTKDMAQSADIITSAVTKVHTISQENKENITVLSSEIAQFKVEETLKSA
jgi:methyl-accepting chemotaxis protein